MIRAYYFILIATIASGCLQNPAVIDGANNYYLDNVETKTKMNREKYRHIDHQNDDCQFDDEKNSKQNKTFDPYTAPPVENLLTDDVDVTPKTPLETDKKQNFQIEEPSSDNADIDWDNIFHDVKDHKIEKKNEQTDAIKHTTHQPTIPNPQPKPINSMQTKPKIIESNKKNQLNDKNSMSTKKTETKSGATPPPTKTTATNPLCCIVKPTNGEVITKYGKAQNSELDDGMTFKISDKTIKSAGDGKVIYVDGENSSHKTVIIKHNNGIISSYSYNGSVKTAVNKEIKSGQIIGEVASDKNILYFTTRHNGKTIDPEKIMK